jgi:hypothetical protein
MANLNLTNQVIARESAAILEEESPFLANCNRDYDREFGKNFNGYNVGDNVDIKIPPIGQVFDGLVFGGGAGGTLFTGTGNPGDHVEQKVNLKLDIVKHMALSFNIKEQYTDMTDFRERVLRPQLQTFSSVIEAEVLKRAVQATPNWVGTAGTVPNTMKTYSQARARLENNLCPPSDRTMLFTSSANVELVDSSKQLFHAGPQIQKMFLKGTLGEAQNAMWYEHQSVPTLTTGTAPATGLTVNGASQTGSTLNIGGLTAAQTITKGTKFTIAGVFAVHPQAGTTLPVIFPTGGTQQLQQFTVTADFTAAGTTGSISIYPPINPVTNKNVSGSPAAAAAITLFAPANTAVTQNLMFQKNAYALAFVPMEKLAGLDSEVATLPNGLSVRVTTFGDGVNAKNATRIDILGAFAAPRGNHACVVLQ